jgi:hypothetical protein
MMMLQNKVPRARLGIAEASDDDDDEEDDEIELEDEGDMAREVIFSNDVYKDIPAGCIISPCVVHALQPDQGLPIKPGTGKVRCSCGVMALQAAAWHMMAVDVHTVCCC